MFRRPESMRERALLRLIEEQQRTITDLTDRIMFLAGRPWEVPPVEVVPRPEPPERTWTETPEQELNLYAG